MSRKSERLVNLTIALLATKRFLTKAEIFSTVAGYAGDSEAKDRMFERDKDDLRSLGIEIELGTFDPLFEDEAGYRIKPDIYALQLEDLDTTSIAILSHAATMWREAALGESAQSGLRKLKGLGLDSDLDGIVNIAPTSHSAPEQLPDLIDAITLRKAISFEYLDENLTPQLRTIDPYRISNARGHWYLIGHDHLRQALRTYRVDRVASSISFVSPAGSYEIDQASLDLADQGVQEVEVALIAVRKGRAAHLRFSGQVSEIDPEWDCLEIQFHNSKKLIEEVLWQGENAYIISPEYLRTEIVSRISRAMELHG